MLGRIVVVDCVQRFRKSGQTVAKGTGRDLGKRGMFFAGCGQRCRKPRPVFRRQGGGLLQTVAGGGQTVGQ